MSEQDRYIPGVPCWIDTAQPDPEAAAAFYGGLFGWEFEDVMPPDAPGRYFIARLRGGDVAAVGSPPEGAPPAAVWNTYVWVDDADETAAKVRAAGGTRAQRAVRRRATPGRMAVFADPEGAAFCVWQAERAPRRRGRQRARLAELQRPQHARPRGARRRSTARSSAGRLLDVGGGSMWALPGYGDFLEAAHARACARAWPRWARPTRFEDVVASLARSPTTSPTRRRTGA